MLVKMKTCRIFPRVVRFVHTARDIINVGFEVCYCIYLLGISKRQTKNIAIVCETYHSRAPANLRKAKQWEKAKLYIEDNTNLLENI